MSEIHIGIGTGDTGQFLLEISNEDTDDYSYAIVDEHQNVRIDLSNPRGLLLVLKERLDRREV